MVSTVYIILRDKWDVLVTRINARGEVVAKVERGLTKQRNKQDRVTTPKVT